MDALVLKRTEELVNPETPQTVIVRIGHARDDFAAARLRSQNDPFIAHGHR